MTKSTSLLFGVLILCSILFFYQSCKSSVDAKKYNELAADPSYLHDCTEHLTDVIVHDIFKPPVASRIYTYSSLAAYETIRQQNLSYKSMAGIITGFKTVPKPDSGMAYCYPLAAVTAFNRIGESLTYSHDMWTDFNKKFNSKFQGMGIPDDVYNRSVNYGEKVAKHILDYAESDNFKQSRNVRFPVDFNDPAKWVPTPPTYAEACEPAWNTTRFFLLDSCSQFKSIPCIAYDTNHNSKYYKLLMEVYNINKHLTEEQKEIARFWDDNAFVTNVNGHMMYATKKMTPPGHWIAIARTVLKIRKSDIMKSAQAYCLSSLAMHDAFIAAWDEKYKSKRVRPITVINRILDPSWSSFLETPAFPEYVSAHSAISAAAGTVLTNVVGDNIPYTDSTELQYGYGLRSFNSFIQAFHETNISRVYGGIHYRDGAFEATKLGEKIGGLVLQKIGLKTGAILAHK